MNPAAPSIDFFDRLMRYDRNGALAVVDDYLEHSDDVLRLYDEILGPALVHAGREWECGRISVAHEHYVTGTVQDLVRRHGPEAWAARPIGTAVAVACCAPRERHHLGILMVADALRAGGVDVLPFGEGLPAEALLDFLGRVRVDLLCLSCALDVHLPDASDLIAGARRARPGLLVAVGGAALWGRCEDLRARLHADLTATNAGEVRRLLPDWLGRLGRSPSSPGPDLHPSQA